MSAFRLMRFGLVATALVLGPGCGRPAADRAIAPTPEPPAERAFGTGQIEIVRRAEDRSIEWSVTAQRAELLDSGPGKLGGTLEQVSGALYKKGGVSSRFTSDSGEADQAANRLVLKGRVRVVAVDPKAVLTAERIVYQGDRQLIEASGGVEVDAGSYRLGPVPTIWATPDLRTVGTPDQFADSSLARPRR